MTDRTMVVRTDFTAPQAWAKVQTRIDHPPGGELAFASFHHVDDPAYTGCTSQQIIDLVPEGCTDPIVVLADEVTMASPELSVLVVDLVDKPGSTFRSIPEVLWNAANNLFVQNAYFDDFAEHAVRDGGIYRCGGRAGQIKLLTAIATLKGVRFDPASLDDPDQTE